MRTPRRSVPASLMLGAIRAYRRHLSSTHLPCCRFSPTCSAYAIEAINRFGAFRGGVLALWRLMRCNPFARGGFDPVPTAWPTWREYVRLSGNRKNG
ncbi:MAG: membrane protein insertion efficiency factor YidD [Clostridiaceae bacterium]|nr:membrane protein insertion efficiency factor YidD [Clostridiaceae bacterium]